MTGLRRLLLFQKWKKARQVLDAAISNQHICPVNERLNGTKEGASETELIMNSKVDEPKLLGIKITRW